jgi:hypothetical protein
MIAEYAIFDCDKKITAIEYFCIHLEGNFKRCCRLGMLMQIFCCETLYSKNSSK